MQKKINSNKSLQKKTHNSQKGFTLLETLVAIFILTLSITGPVYIASVAFRNTIDSRDNISAQYLAEEVIEVIRNNRDKNLLSGNNINNWLSNVTGSASCSNDMGSPINNKCIMQKNIVDGSYAFEVCDEGDCPPMFFDPESTDAVYGLDSSSVFSKFTREFYLEQNPNNTGEVKIVVNIKWTDKGRDKIYTLNERLYAINYNQFFK